MPPSFALASPIMVTAISVSIKVTLSYSTPGPLRQVNPSTVGLAMYFLNEVGLTYSLGASLPLTYALTSAKNLANPLGEQPYPIKLVPGQVLALLLESYLPK